MLGLLDDLDTAAAQPGIKIEIFESTVLQAWTWPTSALPSPFLTLQA
jgi:hypothetical protein